MTNVCNKIQINPLSNEFVSRLEIASVLGDAKVVEAAGHSLVLANIQLLILVNQKQVDKEAVDLYNVSVDERKVVTKHSEATPQTKTLCNVLVILAAVVESQHTSQKLVEGGSVLLGPGSEDLGAVAVLLHFNTLEGARDGVGNSEVVEPSSHQLDIVVVSRVLDPLENLLGLSLGSSSNKLATFNHTIEMRSCLILPHEENILKRRRASLNFTSSLNVETIHFF